MLAVIVLQVATDTKLKLKDIVETYLNPRGDDTSKRKSCKVHLAENEKRYRMLFDEANDAIFLMYGNQFIECNPKALKLFKCSRGTDDREKTHGYITPPAAQWRYQSGNS